MVVDIEIGSKVYLKPNPMLELVEYVGEIGKVAALSGEKVLVMFGNKGFWILRQFLAVVVDYPQAQL